MTLLATGKNPETGEQIFTPDDKTASYCKKKPFLKIECPKNPL